MEVCGIFIGANIQLNSLYCIFIYVSSIYICAIYIKRRIFTRHRFPAEFRLNQWTSALDIVLDNGSSQTNRNGDANCKYDFGLHSS